ncbi:hypothetical protein [Caballeronia mineralivorans]|jgi:hypothetical protein|nr:hypothetical protein [Caballeronia mineralivorans]
MPRARVERIERIERLADQQAPDLVNGSYGVSGLIQKRETPL